jgi:hypothetical protein
MAHAKGGQTMDTRDKKRWVEDLERELVDVNEKLRAHDALLQRKALLEGTITNLRTLIGDNGHSPRTPVKFDTFDVAANPDKDPVWKGIKEVLVALNRPAGAPEITRELEQRGWKFTTNGREFVRSTMMRKLDLFERVGEGAYALKEWPQELKDKGKPF